MLKHKLVDFIIQFMEEVDKEISEMKLFVRQMSNWASDLRHAYVAYMLRADCIQVKRKGKIRGGIVPDTRMLPVPAEYTLANDYSLTSKHVLLQLLVQESQTSESQSKVSSTSWNQCMLVSSGTVEEREKFCWARRRKHRPVKPAQVKCSRYLNIAIHRLCKTWDSEVFRTE